MKKYLPIMILLICVATALGAAQAIQFSNVMFGAYEDRPTTGRFPGDLYIVTSRIGATTPIPWVSMWDSNAADWAALAGTSGDYGADQAGAVWFEDNAIYAEGATDNTYEYIIAFADPTADRTLTLPDVAATAFILNVFADAGSTAISDASSAMTFTLADVGVAGTAANITTIAYTPTALDGAGDVNRGLYIDVNGSANHSNGTSVLIDLDNETDDAQSTDIGIRFDADLDQEIVMSGSGVFTFVDAGTLVLQDASGGVALTLQDVQAAGTGANVATFAYTPTAMDGSGDTTRGIYIDVNGTANHSNGTSVALDIDNETNDAQSTDIGIRIDADFDEHIAFLGASNNYVEFPDGSNIVFRDPASNSRLFVRDVPSAGTANDVIEFDQTLSAMDGMADTFRSFYVDVTTAAHSAGNYVAVDIDQSANTAASYDVGLKVNASFDAGIQSASRVLVRESFDQPFLVMQDDWTAKALADTNENIVFGSPSGYVEYWEEQTKTTSSWVVADGQLDISADDGATNDEGVEIIIGNDDDTTSSWLVAQTDTLCFAASIETTLIAGTDQMVVGWRTAEAYDAGIVLANYTTFAYVGQTNIDGSVFLFVDDGDSANDDSGTNVANGETHIYKVCMESDGGAAGYLDGTEITNTNTTGQLISAGTNMIPFINYLCVNGTDAGILINWWEITAESN